MGLKAVASSAGGGGGAVDSVNGQTGVVELDTGDIPESADVNYVSDAELTTLANLAAEEVLTGTVIDAGNITSNVEVTTGAAPVTISPLVAYRYNIVSGGTGAESLILASGQVSGQRVRLLFTDRTGGSDSIVITVEDAFYYGGSTAISVALDAQGEELFMEWNNVTHEWEIDARKTSSGVVTATPGANSGSFTAVVAVRGAVVSGT